MAYSTSQQTHGELFGRETNRDTIIARTFTWIKARLDMYRAEDELQRMSDGELADVGLNRGDIHNAVRYGRIVP